MERKLGRDEGSLAMLSKALGLRSALIGRASLSTLLDADASTLLPEWATNLTDPLGDTFGEAAESLLGAASSWLDSLTGTEAAPALALHEAPADNSHLVFETGSQPAVDVKAPVMDTVHRRWHAALDGDST